MSVRNRTNRSSHSSQLPRVLLQVNPGIDRQLQDRLNLLERLRIRADVAAEGKKRLFTTSLEDKWNRKLANAERRRKIDDETRRAIDQIKASRRQGMQDRLEKHQKIAARRKQQQEEEENDLDKNDFVAKQEEEDTAVAREGWTPNTVADHSNANTNADDVTIASQVSSIDWGGAGGGVPQSALSSRRSSLKSVSAIELDVVGGADTPGPEHTVEPLQMDEANQQQGGSASKVGSSSRRSSLTSALMPEVVVTKAAKEKSESPTEPEAKDVNKLKAPQNRIWSLLPAPTPTRFVGRMHAVVSRGDNPSSAAAFSRKSSLVSEPIQEDPDGAKSEEEADKETGKETKDDNGKRDAKGKDEVKKEVDGAKSQEKTEDAAEKEKRHMSDGVPTSTRFVGKLRGSLSRMHSMASQDEGSTSSRMSSGGASVRRSSWRTAAQQSREESGSGTRAGSGKGVFKRMASLGGHSGRGSPATSEKDKMATPVGLAKKERRASSYVGSMGKKKSKEIRKFGGVTVKLSHRNSEEILGSFGKEKTRRGSKGKIEGDELTQLVLPGMKRPFSVERQSLGMVGVVLEEEEAKLKGKREQADTPNARQQISADVFAGMSIAGGSGQSSYSNVYNVVTSASKLVKQHQLQQSLSSRPGSSGERGAGGSGADQLGSLVKGVTTTSKLMGKLHSMRAQHTGGGGGGADGTGEACSDPDDKWDWMTGVPTSIRFVGRSWRNIARGPGGIVTESPVSWSFKRSSSASPVAASPSNAAAASNKKDTADFAGTVNMLAMLAKADIKLKSQARDADADSETSGELVPGGGDRMNRRRSTGGGAGPGVLGKRRGSITDAKSGEGIGVARAREGSKDEINAVKTDTDEQNEVAEKEKALKDLMESLSLVEEPTITKWNVDKNIKEESGGAPFLLLLPEHEPIG